MNATQWTIAVVCGVALVFTVFRLWNRDTRGAFQIAAAIILLAALLISVSGCTVSPAYRPYMEAGFGYDFSHTVGSDPVCVVRLRQPIGFGPIKPEWLVAGYTHHSSCGDVIDKNTVDQLEIVARIPLGRSK